MAALLYSTRNYYLLICGIC